MDEVKLSKTLAHALRHEPEAYGLSLDVEGWVSLAGLVAALQNNGWQGIAVDDIQQMMHNAKKQRYQILDGRIRAFYGHSIDEKIAKAAKEPPALLYHGTVADNMASIMENGLLPMGRQYVHLSLERETAEMVAKRRKGQVIILSIQALKAHNDGLAFYEEENGVWLADALPAKYID
jgi:putative RNA 2'-phosphotransferase